MSAGVEVRWAPAAALNGCTPAALLPRPRRVINCAAQAAPAACEGEGEAAARAINVPTQLLDALQRHAEQHGRWDGAGGGSRAGWGLARGVTELRWRRALARLCPTAHRQRGSANTR